MKHDYSNMDASIISVDPETDKLDFNVVNNGGELTSTSYFDTGFAKQGGLYLSWNAGEARLLVPESQAKRIVTEIVGATSADLETTDGMFLVWFDDGQPEQFCVMIQQEMTDRNIEKYGETKLHIFIEGYGTVTTLPLSVLRP